MELLPETDLKLIAGTWDGNWISYSDANDSLLFSVFGYFTTLLLSLFGRGMFRIDQVKELFPSQHAKSNQDFKQETVCLHHLTFH